MANETKQVAAYAIHEDERGVVWQKVGAGVENKDGSFNVLFDCLPVSGRVHIRRARKAGL